MPEAAQLDASGLTRRNFLCTIAFGGAALSTMSLWLPKRAENVPSSGTIKRVIILNAPGGVRWTASFDGQIDPKLNPWGLLNWRLVGTGAPPTWGFSRLLVQKPLFQNSTGWVGHIYPYLTSDDPSHYNLTRPRLAAPGWNGARLPTIADLAGDISVVRTTGNPGGPFNGDHGSASHTLCTGYPSGQVGLVTALHHALRLQLGTSFDSFYDLPPVVIGQPAFSFGLGEFAASRPIFVPSTSVITHGSSYQSHMGESVPYFTNNQANCAAHISLLTHPGLKLSAVPMTGMPPPAFGTLIDGTTPLTNDMLAEAFGLSSSTTPTGDIAWDAFAAAQDTLAPTWALGANDFGLSAVLALRLLQMGSPVISVSVGGFDTHSCEILDPMNRNPQSVQTVLLARSLASLAFVLKNVADPKQPGASLWASTVVLVCSEFGRGGDNIGMNGFNSPNGQNGGGSDHDPWSGWPIFGGPVAARGQLLTDSSFPNGYFHQNRIFTSILKGMAIDATNSSYLRYSTFPAISGLFRVT